MPNGRTTARGSELRNKLNPRRIGVAGPSDVAYDNSGANYDLVTVPAVRATNSAAGHTGLVYGQDRSQA